MSEKACCYCNKDDYWCIVWRKHQEEAEEGGIRGLDGKERERWVDDEQEEGKREGRERRRKKEEWQKKERAAMDGGRWEGQVSGLAENQPPANTNKR